MKKMDDIVSNFYRHVYVVIVTAMLFVFSDNMRDNIRTLKNKSGNSLMLYGKDIPKILDMIERNKAKFKHVPRGPLGWY